MRCEHCADLLKTLDTLRESLPAGSFSVEPRQFPLDGECNPLIEGAARPRALPGGLGSHLPRRQVRAPRPSRRRRSSDRPRSRATRCSSWPRPTSSRQELETCLASEAARRKLEKDIGDASHFDADGTPIVVVNGRKGTSFGPFLYALVLTRGADSNPAFDALPPPNPRAHLH